MSKELKLITELCRALGFDVIEHKETKQMVRCDGGKTPPVIFETIEYSLTDTKEACVKLPIAGDVWSAMTEYVIDHMADIEADINDFGKLQPVLDYFNRNS